MERNAKMGILAIILAGILGAAGMYLLDPITGNRRRAQLRDQMEKVRSKADDTAEAAAVQIKDRAQGAAAEVKSRFQPEQVSDITLVSRVRSELGRATDHAGAIDVTATSGIVALSGHVLAQDLEHILTTARNVPGVQNVENRMMVHDTPDNIPALQGSGVQETGTSETSTPGTGL